jgi:elongation factor G
VPGSALDELARSLRAATQGIGWFSKSFDHFEELYGREADTIISSHAAASA